MSRSRKSLKRKLSLYLIYSPFLRLVLFNKWFRAAFLALLAGGVFLALFLPRMWTSSPDDFKPVVKVSWLDLTQARVLKKRAVEAERRKDYKHANYCWQASIVRNEADPVAVRGFLRNVLNLSEPDKRAVGVAFGQTTWLLRLEKTNVLDVELCARVYEKFRWHDLVVQSFEGQVKELTTEAKAIYLKSLFHVGRVEEFARMLEEVEERKRSPELHLYEAAYLAGWSSDPRAVGALEQLRKAAEDDGSFDRLSLRLYMLVSAKRGELEAYRSCLGRLGSMNEATVLEHIGYWRLLMGAGRTEEAQELARAFSRPPGTPIETVQLARIFQALELKEECREVLEQHAPAYYFSPEVWAAYATLLESEQDWEGMRGIALRMRRHPGVQGLLDGFSYFLEGRTELAQERRGPAEGAFRRAAEARYEQVAVGYMVARELNALKFFEGARKIFQKIESSYEERVDFWEAAFEAGYALRDGEWMLRAAKRLYELKPGDIQALNGYAASLMVNRARPAEAVRLTLEMTARYPNSPTAVLNHCFALLLNNRNGEAKDWLERINPEALDPVESSAYHLALFELNCNLKNYGEAWRASDKIFTSQLFPAQLEWLAARQKEMPPRLTSAK